MYEYLIKFLFPDDTIGFCSKNESRKIPIRLPVRVRAS